MEGSSKLKIGRTEAMVTLTSFIHSSCSTAL